MASRGFLVGDHNIRPRRPVRYVASKQTKAAKRKKKKPEWDNTVNDLNVHKATKDEQIKRHELHKSKNTGRVHLVKDQSLDSIILTPDTVERRKMAIVQEVLYGQDKFQDVLSESDKAMSVVKDLFGDDPKKFMGFPNITAAPSNILYGKENKFPVGPVAEMPETPTHLSLLSDSVMRTPALNELPDDDRDDEELSPGTPPSGQERNATSSFQPLLDLQRFQQYVADEQSKYAENHSPPLLSGHGTNHVPPHGSTAVRQAIIPSTVGASSGPFGGGRGTNHVPPHGSTAVGQATIPSTVGTQIIDGSFRPFHGGRGTSHVLPHGSISVGQATIKIPSTVVTKIIDEGSGPLHGGRGTDHVPPHGNMVLGAHSSQPPSFLSQESAGTVIAGGPNFVTPVSIGEPTASNGIPPNVRVQSSSAGTDQQGFSNTKTRGKTSHKPTSNSSSSGLRSLDDLKKMVEELETEVTAYEYETGRQQTTLSSETCAGSFSGYTASLITAVTKLMGYLKESEIQRKAEMIMREQVLQGFEEQRALVDALTNDILHTQEQNLTLQHELLQYRKNTDEQLQYLKRELFTVLRSHEYQALSSSINTLYSLNPVALKQGAFDALNPRENHSLGYLPGAPVLQVHNTRDQERIGHSSTSRDFTADTRNKPSFIPLATSQHDQYVPQASDIHRMPASSPQVSQAYNQPVNSSRETSVHGFTDQDNYTVQQHLVAPSAASVHQLPHNGYVQSVYRESGSTSVNNGIMTGHGQISSNIVMYPPSQVHFTQAGSRERESVAGNPHMTLSKPSIHPVRNQPTPEGTIIGTSTAPPLYSPHQLTPGQSVSNAQAQVPDQPAGSNTMEPMPGGPQGFAIPAQGGSPRLSQAMPPPDDSRLASPNHSKKLESTRQITSSETSVLSHQQQPPLQVHAQPAPQLEQASKSRGFVPISRTMIGGLPASQQLRERLQNLANRQRSMVARSVDQDMGSVHQHNLGEVLVQQPRPNSPHVRFQDPPVAVNGHDKRQHSPPVSPIPFKNPAAVLRSTAPPDKRVVVNLPNAWSDVSSTISL